MKYKLKKLSKTAIYNAVEEFTDYTLPKKKDCDFVPYPRSAAGRIECHEYHFFMDACAGDCFIHVQSTVFHDGDKVDKIIRIPFNWLLQNGYLREVPA